MFTLTLPNGQTVGSINHLALNKHTRMQSNVAKSKVNYFKWAAYPELSEGKILVLEATFLAAIAAGTITGLQCTLTIADVYNTQVFDNVAILGIEIYNTFLVTDGDTPVGNRLLCLTLGLDRRIPPGVHGLGFEDALLSGSHEFWSTLVSYLFVNPLMLVTPAYFNKYINYFNEPVEKIAGYVANSQFLTAYPRANASSSSASSSSTSVTTGNFRAALTNAVFDPTSINPGSVLFVDSGQTYKNIFLTLSFLNSNYKFGVMEYYPTTGVSYTNAPSDVSANVTALLTPEVVSYTYPFELLDLDYQYPSSSGSGSAGSEASSGSIASGWSPGAIVNAYYVAFQQNCINRFSSRIHLVLQGVSTQSITNDIQRITYAYDERGFTTTLQTVPWKLPEISIINQSTNNLLFIAKLNQDMEGSTIMALADIYHPLNSLTVVDENGLVYDPLNLISRYCKNTRCYVARTLEGGYVVISGPCNATVACPSSGSSMSASVSTSASEGPPSEGPP